VEKRRAGKKKVGRPTTGKRPVLAVRVHEPLYERIKSSADDRGLSISEETERRLADSLEWERRFGGFDVAPLFNLLAGAFGMFNEEASLPETEMDERYRLLTAVLARALNSTVVDFYSITLTMGDANIGPGKVYSEFANRIVRDMDAERERLNKDAGRQS
jgi:hypothetical protein